MAWANTGPRRSGKCGASGKCFRPKLRVEHRPCRCLEAAVTRGPIRSRPLRRRLRAHQTAGLGHS